MRRVAVTIGQNMSNAPEQDDESRPYYGFSEAEVGKHYERYRKGTNLAKIDEDLAKDFPTSEAVNAALRRYRELVQTRNGPT